MSNDSPSPALPAPRPAADADRTWADAIIENELNKLANLPAENPNKPGSVFGICLFNIAAVVKGDGRHIPPAVALDRIKAACRDHISQYHNAPDREIERQWSRAYKKADGRRRPHTNGAAAPARPVVKEKPAPAGTVEINTKYPKTGDYQLAFKQLGYTFRMNQLDDSVECNGDPMTDGLEAVILNGIRDLGLSNADWVRRAWLMGAYQNRYHPVQEYFSSLAPKWDGKDWIFQLVERYTVETTRFGYTALLRWMIGAVAKVFEQAQNFMLVIDGPQNVGKSTLARWLCPLPPYFIEGGINTEDKDASLRLCTKLVWEVGELQATTRKADREALKQFITSREVTVRRAYGRYDIVKPAMCSLIGTINEDGSGFLTDPTGNRRFAIICLEKINHDYSKELDVSQLWAQAVALYQRGNPWRFTTEEMKQQAEINGRYESTSVLADMFFDHFAITNDESKHMGSSEILQTLEDAGLKGSQEINKKELARLMKKLNCTRGRGSEGGKRLRGYRRVVPIDQVKKEEDIPF